MTRSLIFPLASICLLFATGLHSHSASPPTEDLIIIQKGVGVATIVTADNPSPVASLAAHELASHLEKATGVRLEILPESQATKTDLPRIYVGQTDAAVQHGLAPQELPKDAFRLKTVGKDLFVYGAEQEETVNRKAYKGTLYGVYEILDRFLGVRWLWPGELGTYVPTTQTAAFPAQLDETIHPSVKFRNFRVGHIRGSLENYSPDMQRMGFTVPVLKQYADDLDAYLLRHHLGVTEDKPIVGHYFSHWWNRYGKDHPEWFMMRADGTRGPSPNGSEADKIHTAMNVANPDLHRFILEEDWDGGDTLRLGEVDRRASCMSPESKAWDVTPKEPIPDFARLLYRPALSDRYARFWQTIQDKAVKRNPNVLITTFLYFNYLPAPVKSYRLQNVYGEYVPWGSPPVVFYPMSDEAHQWNKKQWKGWAATGMQMGYRPNYLLGGYVMPHLSTWQAGDMFKFAAAEGMTAFDFDALWAQWAVKGPMYYVHMRLVKNPKAEVRDLRREYFSAFGPAASEVEKYFDYWEDYSLKKAPIGGVGWNDPTNTRALYPPRAFQSAQALLDNARQKASSILDSTNPADNQFLARIAFLQIGLDHARLSAEFIGSLDPNGTLPISDPKRIIAAQEALKRLIEFRRKHETTYFSDLIAAAKIENRRIDIARLVEMNPEQATKTTEIPGESLAGQWLFQADPKDEGVNKKWFTIDKPEANTWQAVQVPAPLGSTAAGKLAGYGWYYTRLEISDTWSGQDLRIWFQGVNQQAWVYINGEYVGEHSVASEKRPVGKFHQEPFVIKVPAALVRPDNNYLMVRVHSAGGGAGIWGSVSITPADDLM